MRLLILLGFASWPLAGYLNTRFRRSRPVAIAIREAVFCLLASLCVGITLIDLYFATLASEPASDRVHLFLFLTVLWFGLPSIAFCVWLALHCFRRSHANPNNA